MAIRRLDAFIKLDDNIIQKKFNFQERIMQEAECPKKTKTTLYMSESDERLLDEVFIKRLRERNKTDRSAIICEAIRLLYEKEVESKE